MNTQQALQLHATGTTITADQLRAQLAGLRGVTMANITTVTDVETAAAFRHLNIVKVSRASVQLFNELRDADAYGRAVRRSAGQIADNDPADVAAQRTKETWYVHDADCHSIVRHRTTGEPYLYAFYNTGASEYVVDGVVTDRADILQYLRDSDRKALLGTTRTFNVSDNLYHEVVVRVLKMKSIVAVRARNQTVSV
jgi:hypothetical protein